MSASQAAEARWWRTPRFWCRFAFAAYAAIGLLAVGAVLASPNGQFARAVLASSGEGALVSFGIGLLFLVLASFEMPFPVPERFRGGHALAGAAILFIVGLGLGGAAILDLLAGPQTAMGVVSERSEQPPRSFYRATQYHLVVGGRSFDNMDSDAFAKAVAGRCVRIAYAFHTNVVTDVRTCANAVIAVPTPVPTAQAATVELSQGLAGVWALGAGRLYVLNPQVPQANGSLSVLDGEDGALLHRYLPPFFPESLAVDEGHQRALIGSWDFVRIIDLHSWQVLNRIKVRTDQSLLAYDPMHQRLAFNTLAGLHQDQNALEVVDIPSGRTIAMTPNYANSDPAQLEVAPRADRFVFSLRGFRAISLVDTATGHLVKTLSLAGYPYHFALDDAAGLVAAPMAEANALAIASLWTGTILHTVPVGSNPTAAVIDPRRSRIFVANSGDGTIAVVDEQMGKLIRTISIPSGADNVAVNPTRGQLYVAGGGNTRFGSASNQSTITVVREDTGVIAASLRGTTVTPDLLAIVPQTGTLVMMSASGTGVGLLEGKQLASLK